ncbi:hypothetical protein CVT24_006349 [Panaeolus cyanescens]|uniref:F-box domain-containing protein n=1 Tax=Panaeolus cyanescens TaxID=181874 RepID=A0A409YE70_9AGAR|nr:hypothetical protein CVT24_006349 [Panaeolus cyanescens]
MGIPIPEPYFNMNQLAKAIEPYLPVELERKIFELAFNPDDPVTNGRMILVARRTRSWLRPMIYRVFSLHSYRRFPKLAICPDEVNIEEIIGYAEHLIIDTAQHTTAEAAVLIEICPNIQNLAVWGSHKISELFDTISGLRHLRRLSGTFHTLTREQLMAPMFSSLTHFELLFPRRDWPFDALRSFTQLTHFIIYGEGKLSWDQMPFIISFCNSLQALIICTSHRDLPEESLHVLDAEPRLVVFEYSMSNADDWIRGAHGQVDIWWYADKFVFARKKHYFRSNEYRKSTISSDFNWLEHLTEEGKRWYLSLV